LAEELMRNVVILVFPGSNLLDVAGPAQVFTSAAELHRATNKSQRTAYSVKLASLHGGTVKTTSAVELNSSPLSDLRESEIDTLLIAGGHGSEAAGYEPAIASWLVEIRPHLRRLGSICTGAFILAAAGLAENKRLATHWAYCDRLALQYPNIHVERDAIFIEDGGLWSSAGISSGLDLALAMVEQDHGRDIALMVARQLVVFLKRPGGQSQFSVPLEVQSLDGPLAQLAATVTDNPAGDHRIETLAKRGNMSVRTLHRMFNDAFGRPPGQWVAALRIECARRILEQSNHSLDQTAAQTGFGSADSMRRLFLRHLGVTPSEYRQRFRREPAHPSPAVQHALHSFSAQRQ
jgi:transcriptional regulator GlxA family with amidase domain